MVCIFMWGKGGHGQQVLAPSGVRQVTSNERVGKSCYMPTQYLKEKKRNGKNGGKAETRRAQYPHYLLFSPRCAHHLTIYRLIGCHHNNQIVRGRGRGCGVPARLQGANPVKNMGNYGGLMAF